MMRGSQCRPVEVAADIQIVRAGLRCRFEQAHLLEPGEPFEDVLVRMAAQTGADHGGVRPGTDQFKHAPVFNGNVSTLVQECLLAGAGASVDSLCWLHARLHGWTRIIAALRPGGKRVETLLQGRQGSHASSVKQCY